MKIKKIILKALLILLMIITVFAAFTLVKGFISSQVVNDENKFSGNDLSSGNNIKQKNKDELLFLFAGVDSTGEKLNTRTDTLMLVLMNKKSKTIDIISIPRDTRVYVDGNLDKINAAHSYGGMGDTIRTVRDFLYIDLDYYAEISFKAVEDGVDKLGGVDIDVPKEIAEAQEIEPGLHHFNGKEALDYCRFRKGYANADLGRISCQQDFVVQFIKNMTKVKNIIKIPGVISKVNENMDSNIKMSTILSFAWAFRNIDDAEINTQTIPGYPDMIDGVSYYIPDNEGTIDIRNKILYNYLLEE